MIISLTACCGWTIYSKILGPDINPLVDKPPATSQAVIGQPNPVVTFEDRLAMLTEPTFEDRFAAAAPLAIAPSMPASDPKPLPRSDTKQSAAPEITEAVPMPSMRPAPAPRARKATDKIGSVPKMPPAPTPAVAQVAEPTIFEKLFSGLKPAPLLAYAPSDQGVTGSEEKVPLAGPQSIYDQQTAVYDISARTVYLPNGTRLEAHSGLGDKMDDPRFVHVRMRGATPPHVYNLSLREELFHGVQAIRLTPIGGKSEIHDRTGLLAHPYMLGTRGDSNGCVSFKNYEAFLNAYRSGEIKRLAVVARLN